MSRRRPRSNLTRLRTKGRFGISGRPFSLVDIFFLFLYGGHVMRPRGEHYNALALDLGTSTGWALLGDDRILASGTEHFRMEKDLGTKASGIRMKQFLEFIKSFHYVNECFYEHNFKFQQGEKAIKAYYGMLAVLEMVTAAADIELIAVHTSTLKKNFTGSGRAQKFEIGDRCIELGWKQAVFKSALVPDGNGGKYERTIVANDDEADAIALLFGTMWERNRDISF